MARDIALNPGLARFPCTVRTHPVRDDQREIQCDGCMKWTHAGCANVSVDFYNQLEAKVEFSWHCLLCLFQALPLLDVLDGSVSSSSPDSENLSEDPSTIDLLEATISGVRIVHHNVQGIQSKIIELTQWFKVCGGTAAIFCFTETWLKPCLTCTSASTAYTEFLTDYHLIQHISELTRLTSSSATLIGHILATPCTVVHSVYQSVGLSDHMVQFVDVDLSVVCPRPTTIFVHSF